MRFHTSLNNKLWDEFKLRREVYKHLLQISKEFISYLDVPKEAVKDIRIVGSSANYNYSSYSDLDIHIVIDYEKVHKSCPLVEGYLWALKSLFNKEHDIKIYGIPVELYAENSRTEAISNGAYSLMNDEWIKRPEKIKVSIDDTAVRAKYGELKEAVDKCTDVEEARSLLDKIYRIRKAGLTEAGEFSVENVVFKKLRNSRTLDKLRRIRKEDMDKALTLESLLEEYKRLNKYLDS